MTSSSSGAIVENYASLKSRVLSLESRIENASTNDERLSLAIEAAELALRAIKLAASKPDQVEMKSRASSLLKQAETFKQHKNSPNLQAQNLPLRSRTPVSLASSRSPAPQSDSASSSRSILSTRELSASGSEPRAYGQTAPKSRRELSKAEQILLMRGSKLNHCKFPPWAATPNNHDFNRENQSSLFIDDLEMRLSDAQLEYLDDWRRAADAIPPPTWYEADRGLLPLSMERNFPAMDLVQDATTDCSVVASMCACIARSSKGHPKLLGGLIYPWDERSQKPMLSPNGKYIVKLNFNGSWRRVIIDDRLPVSKTKRVLHVVDRKNPQLLWPALIEKAYLKVRGGYDFPGSNSGTDLWIIAGWIPEQIFLQDSDTDLSDTWTTMLKGWIDGNVLITMGTGAISRKVERADGLASQHDYAVLDLFDDGEHQLIQLKNPWREGRSWTGKISGVDNLDEDELNEERLERRRKLQAIHKEELPSGTFWIPWNDVQQHFESIYCNWNPSMFTHREDIHFSWDLRTKRGTTGSFASNPQFSITAGGSGEVWILLCRHFQDDSSSAVGEGQNISIDSSGVMQGHINIYLYDQGGKRLHVSSPPCGRGHYVDAPQVLCKARVEKAKSFTAVVSEQGLPDIRQNFSLTVFAKVPIALDFAKDPYPHSTTVDSAWTSASAGGRSGSLTFYNNPMFIVHLHQKSSLALLLTTPPSDLSINLKLVHSGGKRIQSFNNRDLISDSGDYRRGSALAEVKNLDPGTYTIVSSTFEPNQKAAFNLQVDSTSPITLKQLPSQYAGKIGRRLPIVHFAPEVTRIGARLRPLRHCTLAAAVTSYYSTSGNDSRTPIRLSVIINPGPNEQATYTSNEGDFNDGRTASVQLHEMNMWPGSNGGANMWLMAERMSGTGNVPEVEEYGLDLYCDGRLEECVEVGEWRRFDD